MIRTSSYGSVKVFWLDRDDAFERVRRAARHLVDERPDVRAVYLFGSLAEGRAVPGSDVDLLILLGRSDRPWLERPLDFIGRFDGVGMPVELFCYTAEEAEHTPLARRAMALGVPLAVRDASGG